MFCSNCGGKIEEGVKFCPGCGNAVGGASAAVVAPAAPVVNTQGAVPTQSVMADEMYCFSCGSVIKKIASICPKCGVNQSMRSRTTAINVYCSSCGKTINKEAVICPFCGVSQGSAASWIKDKRGAAIASLVLGINSLWAWLLPIAGFPVAILGLLMGIVGRKSAMKKLAMAGLILSIIGLVATIVNSAIGAYQGATSQLPGTIIITGIPAIYNGKYAAGEGFLDTSTGQIEFIAADKIDNEFANITGGQIKNGTVTLKVWEIKEDGSIVIFTGSGNGWIDDLLFFNDPSYFSKEIGGGDGEVTFINGICKTTLNFFDL